MKIHARPAVSLLKTAAIFLACLLMIRIPRLVAGPIVEDLGMSAFPEGVIVTDIHPGSTSKYVEMSIYPNRAAFNADRLRALHQSSSAFSTANFEIEFIDKLISLEGTFTKAPYRGQGFATKMYTSLGNSGLVTGIESVLTAYDQSNKVIFDRNLTILLEQLGPTHDADFILRAAAANTPSGSSVRAGLNATVERVTPGRNPSVTYKVGGATSDYDTPEFRARLKAERTLRFGNSLMPATVIGPYEAAASIGEFTQDVFRNGNSNAAVPGSWFPYTRGLAQSMGSYVYGFGEGVMTLGVMGIATMDDAPDALWGKKPSEFNAERSFWRPKAQAPIRDYIRQQSKPCIQGSFLIDDGGA